MATEKKYLSFDKLSLYDQKLKTLIDEKDAATLASAQAYANGLAENYDAAGSAAAVQGKLDEEVARAKGAEEANAGAIAEVAENLGKLDTKVGTLPEGKASVVEYINEKTSGIASEGVVNELSGRMTTAEQAIDAIEADYLKAADKAEVLEAVGAEESRAKGVEQGLETRLKAVEDDYLKAADKTELQGTINDHKAILDAVKEDVDAFFLEADFSEAAKDTLKELQTYIASDESGAAQMAENIQKNKDDIAGVAGRVTTLEGSMTQAQTDIDNVEAKVAELEAAMGDDGSVAEQIAAAVKVEEDARKLADQGLQSAIDGVAGRTTILEGKMTTVEGAVATKAEQADLNAATGRITTVEGKVTTLEGKMTTVEGKVSTLEGEMDAAEGRIAANEQAIAANVTAIGKKADQTALEAEIERAQAAEKANADAIAAFVEISESEINSLFAQN